MDFKKSDLIRPVVITELSQTAFDSVDHRLNRKNTTTPVLTRPTQPPARPNLNDKQLYLPFFSIRRSTNIFIPQFSHYFFSGFLSKWIPRIISRNLRPLHHRNPEVWNIPAMLLHRVHSHTHTLNMKTKKKKKSMQNLSRFEFEMRRFGLGSVRQHAAASVYSSPLGF